jgi:hypothetical protein
LLNILCIPLACTSPPSLIHMIHRFGFGLLMELQCSYIFLSFF